MWHAIVAQIGDGKLMFVPTTDLVCNGNGKCSPLCAVPVELCFGPDKNGASGCFWGVTSWCTPMWGTQISTVTAAALGRLRARVGAVPRDTRPLQGGVCGVWGVWYDVWFNGYG